MKKINFLPDASLLSQWGSEKQPFFALFAFDGRLAATPISQLEALNGQSDGASPRIGDCALRFSGFGAARRRGTPVSRLAGAADETNNSGTAVLERPAEYTLKIVEPPDRNRVLADVESLQTEMRSGRSYLVNYCSQTGVFLGAPPLSLFERSQVAFTVWLEEQFICFSPEAFVSVAGDVIYTNPMKGTGTDAQALMDDPKEQAEHATVVDLLRNDLGRVATGVKIDEYRFVSRIERATGPLYQTSTRISGQLPADWRAHLGDWLPAMLPAGSISGAPKQETLQLIRTTESEPRGFFTGVAVLFDGENLQSAVLIRYLDLSGPQVKFRSGAGITIYSDPAAEYDEILSKVYVPL